MRPVAEDTIAKFSWGILGAMALGLFTGAAAFTRLSDKQDNHERAILELQASQAEVSQVKTDVAVIKSEVHQLKQMLEKDQE